MTARSLRSHRPRILLAGIVLAAIPAGPAVADHPATPGLVASVADRNDHRDVAIGADDTIVDVAREAGSFDTLLAALDATDLLEELDGEGPFTVLAPTDEAFAALPDGALESLLEEPGRGTLKTILRRHVVPGAQLRAADLAGRRTVRTAGGARIAVDFDPEGLRVGGATVVAADVAASDGLIHVIDSVILPPSQSIAELAAESEALSTLVTAVRTAGLAETLGTEGPFTVLAPTNRAFADLDSGVLEALLRPENREALVAVLSLHVIPGRVYAEDALAGARVRTLADERVRLRFENGGLRANDASVVAADIEAANGLVHVIDGVLIPEDLELRGAGELLVGIVPGDVSGRLLRGLDVRRNLAVIGIDDVLAGGGAEAAGLREGDVIVSVNGAPATRERLDEAKREAGPGGTVELEIVRRVRVRVLREGERIDDH